MTAVTGLQRDNGLAEVLAGKKIREGLPDVLDALEAMFWRLNDAVA